MRKEASVTIDDEGRDKGKVFLIHELSAADAERWALRLFLALAKAGVEIPEDIATQGLAGVARLGLKALTGLSFDDAEPLLAEMMECVQIIPDPARPQVKRPLIEDDIEEVATRLRLRAETFSLHTGFSIPGPGSKPTLGNQTGGSRSTKTSRQ